MDYIQNIVWCSRSNWDGGYYNCRHMVVINKYESYDTDNWNNLIDPKADVFFDKDHFDFMKTQFNHENLSEHDINKMYERVTCNLKPHVLNWLHKNVAGRNDTKSPQGWAIGSIDYRYNNNEYFSVFFHRKNDAMAFIKEFSVYKKPVFLRNSFKNIHKQLDLTTLQYTNV